MKNPTRGSPVSPDEHSRRRGGRLTSHGYERPLVACDPFDTARVPTVRPIVAARVLWSNDTRLLYQGTPPAAAGRECQLCPTILSQWNPDVVCGPCQRAARAIWPPLEFERPSVVYYAERDGRIKIGTSTKVERRVAFLRLTLLATEPGGFAEEAQRHKFFSYLRITGEWFRPGRELLNHLVALGAEAEQVEQLAYRPSDHAVAS